MICNLFFPSVQNVGHIIAPVRGATARLVIEHILVNDELKYDPKDLFFWNAARGSASWRRAVVPLVIEHVCVNEYSSMIYNLCFFWGLQGVAARHVDEQLRALSSST